METVTIERSPLHPHALTADEIKHGQLVVFMPNEKLSTITSLKDLTTAAVKDAAKQVTMYTTGLHIINKWTPSREARDPAGFGLAPYEDGAWDPRNFVLGYREARAHQAAVIRAANRAKAQDAREQAKAKRLRIKQLAVIPAAEDYAAFEAEFAKKIRKELTEAELKARGEKMFDLEMSENIAHFDRRDFFLDEDLLLDYPDYGNIQ